MFVVACRLMDEQHIKGQVLTDVTEKVKGFKAGNNETTHVALSKQQALDMLESVDQSTILGKRDYAVLLMLLKTGLRRSELVALNKSDITMRDGHHVAIVRHGKGDNLRMVKLRVEVFRALTEYVGSWATEEDGPLFVRIRRGDHPTGQRLTDKAVEKIVAKYDTLSAQSLGGHQSEHLTPHGLRATFATIALERDAPLHQVQYAMGHRNPLTTERYQKRKLNLDHNAVDYLDF